MNILVTSAGRRVELLQLLCSIGVGQVYAADMSPSAPALYCADGAYLLPPVTRPDYLNQLIDICCELGVDLVIPTIDSGLEVLAEGRERLAADGIRVAVSAPDVVRTCMDKVATSVALGAAGLPTIPTIAWTTVPPPDVAGPVVVKPRSGSCSRGVRTAPRISALGTPPDDEAYVIQPFITGVEVTIDVVAEKQEVVAIGARRRLKVRGGEIERGVTVEVGPFLPMARQLTRALGMDGPFNVQVFPDSADGLLISDVNARLGGGMPLSQQAGAGILEAVLRLSPDTESPTVAKPGIVMMRYDSSVYRAEEDLLQCAAGVGATR